MGGLRSTSDPLRTLLSPFGSVGGPNGPKTGPPGKLSKRSLLNPILTLMNSASDFEIHLNPGPGLFYGRASIHFSLALDPSGSVPDLNEPKTNLPPKLSKRSLQDSIRTPNDSALDFQVHSDPLRIRKIS